MSGGCNLARTASAVMGIGVVRGTATDGKKEQKNAYLQPVA
ncbi:MAG: hypothetical protein ACYCYR_10275 [Desulfobulbaceae bacterium]